jgi:hypothetical protein
MVESCTDNNNNNCQDKATSFIRESEKQQDTTTTTQQNKQKGEFISLATETCDANTLIKPKNTGASTATIWVDDNSQKLVWNKKWTTGDYIY